MLTAQAPPHNDEIYASHHTSNAQIEGAYPSTRRDSLLEVVQIPDTTGNLLDIDLSDYDPSDLSRKYSWPENNAFAPPASEPRFVTPSTSPLSNQTSWLSNQILSAYAKDVTEQQLMDTVAQRAEALRKQFEALKRQLEMATKVEQQMKDPYLREKVLGCLNERRNAEWGKERERVAQRIRMSFEVDDL
jgi:hypothetical protein